MRLVYALVDLKKPDAIRYVGSTKHSIQERFGQHLSSSRKVGGLPVAEWINKIKGNVGLINLTAIEDISENDWIATAAAAGHKLLNISSNGTAHSHRIATAWKDPVSRANMLKRNEALRLARCVEGLQTVSARTKMGLLAIRKEPPTEQVKKKISKSLLGRKLKPHSEERKLHSAIAVRLWHMEKKYASRQLMDVVWLRLLRDVVKEGVLVSPRGQPTREILSSLIIVNMATPVTTIVERKMGYRFMAAEAAWILSGDNRLETIVPYTKTMANFSDDGKTLFGAYGPRLKAQLAYVIKTLKEDPTSRQAVINIWRENPMRSKDIPCTISCQFMIRDVALHAFVTMRSSDVWLGCVYDIFTFSMFGAYVLLELGNRSLKLGSIYQVAASRHLYEHNLEEAQLCLDQMTVGFTYDPLDPYEFVNGDELTNHLWKIARQEERSHAFLKELP